ncbi:MAG TPA: HAD family hydrolase [Candidatus Eisenbacteria bacterium]|nr:HAD family hydrolase [Candidatus Eisenbacteria bacterium]
MSHARPALEAVVFDAGGTLVRLDFEWMAEALTRIGVNTEASTLRRAEVEGRRRYDASQRAGRHDASPLGGPGDVRAYLGGMLHHAHVPAEKIDGAVDAFLAHEKANGLWARPMEGAREAIDATSELGLRRAVVSNSDGRAEWHLRHSGVLDGIEFVVDSHLVGLEKPDPAIFRLALDRLKIPAERALYVGDIRSVDERGSRAAGMHFVLIDPSGDYAGATPSIRAIADLPSWITTHFEVPRAAQAGREAIGG